MRLKKIADGYEKVAAIVCKWLGYIIGVWFFILLLALTYQVVARFILNNSASWTEELASYSLVWIVMIGISIGIFEFAIPRVEVVINYLPAKVQVALELLVDCLCCVFFYIMIRYGFTMSIKMLPQRISSLHITVTYMYLSIPIGGVFNLFFTIGHILQNICKFKYHNIAPSQAADGIGGVD